MQLKRFVRYTIALITIFALFPLVALPAAAQTVTINGNAVDISPAPIMQAGRVFVPLRGVFEQLGASVVYSNGAINATGNGRNISLQIGSTQATVNGQPQIIDVAPFIVGASTYVPLRFISEALGASVDWDNANNIVAISTAGGSSSYVAPTIPSYSDTSTYVDAPPPPIPDYEQPYVPQQNDIWQPGYWAWGQYGYYWVPGTWVQPPRPNYLWTPGYWGSSNGGFGWNPGYWALAVGFYGGLNYGGGYNGNGYDGGRWDHDRFRYNTAATRVNTTDIHNVYTNNNVYINNSTTRISYNGGPNGVRATPSAQQLAIARVTHLGLTAAQKQHVQVAARDHRLLATVNHNVPPILAVARPLSTANRPAGFVPVTAADRAKIQAHTIHPAAAAPVHPAAAAPVHPAAAVPVHPAAAAPFHPAAAARVHPAPAAPVHPVAAPVHPAAAPVQPAAAPVHPAAAPVHPAPAAPAHPAPAAPVHPAPAAPVHPEAAPVHPAAAPVHPAAAPVHRAEAPVHPAAAPVHPAAAPVHPAAAPIHPEAAPAHPAPAAPHPAPANHAPPPAAHPAPAEHAAPAHPAPAEKAAPKKEEPHSTPAP